MRALLHRLARDRGGNSLMEFGLSLPVVAALGLYAIETTNYAVTQMRVNQIALNLADNASRVGTDSALTTQQLREVDMNDVLQAARYQGQGIGLTTNGRITVSSLENVTGTQVIHWQRCIGTRSGTGWDSSYGTTSTTAGTTTNASDAGTAAPSGMGPSGRQVNAPSGYGVMFVEVNYQYQPIVSAYFLGDTKMSFIASYIVRDNRDFTQIYNPSPAATRSTCNLYPS